MSEPCLAETARTGRRNSTERAARWLLGGFVVLTLAKIGSTALAQLALNHFAQRTLAELCLALYNAHEFLFVD